MTLQRNCANHRTRCVANKKIGTTNPGRGDGAEESWWVHTIQLGWRGQWYGKWQGHEVDGSAEMRLRGGKERHERERREWEGWQVWLGVPLWMYFRIILSTVSAGKPEVQVTARRNNLK